LDRLDATYGCRSKSAIRDYPCAFTHTATIPIMTRMIPPRPRSGANTSEKRIFDAFAGAHGTDDWIVLHSLEIRRHATQFEGETDFIVLIPGRGIVVIEAKSP